MCLFVGTSQHVTWGKRMEGPQRGVRTWFGQESPRPAQRIHRQQSGRRGVQAKGTVASAAEGLIGGRQEMAKSSRAQEDSGLYSKLDGSHWRVLTRGASMTRLMFPKVGVLEGKLGAYIGRGFRSLCAKPLGLVWPQWM